MWEFISISTVILLAAISPGPDFAMVSRNALLHGRQAGVMTALGIASSIFVHTSYCIVGLALVVSQSLLLFNVIKYIGAAYLIYLGIKGLKSKYTTESADAAQTPRSISPFKAYQQGLLCNLLNPKCIMFFLAFFTVMIKPSMPWLMQIGHGVDIALIHLVWFSVVSYIFSHEQVRRRLSRFMHYITKGFGGILVLFGLRVASLSHH